MINYSLGVSKGTIMKKLLTGILILVLLVSLTACDEDEQMFTVHHYCMYTLELIEDYLDDESQQAIVQSEIENNMHQIAELEGNECQEYSLVSDVYNSLTAGVRSRVVSATICLAEFIWEDDIIILAEYPEDSSLTYSWQIEFCKKLVSEQCKTIEVFTAEDEFVVSVWDGTVATSFSGGSGLKDDPYLINSASELAYLAQKVNEGKTYAGQYYQLCCNIELNDYFTMTESFAIWNNDLYFLTGGESYDNLDGQLLEWTPIGTPNSPFSGFFDGNNHIIIGMYIYETEEKNIAGDLGLFGTIESATISNLRFVASCINGWKSHVGIVVGNAEASHGVGTTIENCTIWSDCIIAGHSYFNYVGGIVGLLDTDDCTSYIKNCFSEADMIISSIHTDSNGYSYPGGIGGIVGETYASSGNVIISRCIFDGIINSKDGAGVGGIAGSCNEKNDFLTYIENCLNSSTKIYGRSVGGFVGNSSGTVLSNCVLVEQEEAVDWISSGDDADRFNNVIVVTEEKINNDEWLEESIGITFPKNPFSDLHNYLYDESGNRKT